METVLERQRRCHEELERIEQAIVEEMEFKASTNVLKDKINSDHRIKLLAERTASTSQVLLELYADKDKMRHDEVNSMCGPDEFAEFYKRLKQLKDLHKKNPNEIEEPMSEEFRKLAEERVNEELLIPLVHFSDEECHGKCLELHKCHQEFCNLPDAKRVDYMSYLNMFDRLADIPREKKKYHYKKYLQSLLGYLTDFLCRVEPLLDLKEEFEKVNIGFEEDWNNKSFMGWERESFPSSAMVKQITPSHTVDLSQFSTPLELCQCGLEELKNSLQELGIKCGGTLEERALRLFSTKGLTADLWDPRIMAKENTIAGSLNSASKEIALIEAKIYWMVDKLSDQRDNTKEYIERKLSRAAGEFDSGSGDSEISDADSDTNDDILYNPKKLPLGWDGKPIPYWLYKLHGLNISYTCEICGRAVYKGPKAFQRHFSEYKHAYGMRKLGIPNTAHFANITQIEDALALWEKIKDAQESVYFDRDREIEFEDSGGNVINRKTYDDLRRQGLL